MPSRIYHRFDQRHMFYIRDTRLCAAIAQTAPREQKCTRAAVYSGERSLMRHGRYVATAACCRTTSSRTSRHTLITPPSTRSRSVANDTPFEDERMMKGDLAYADAPIAPIAPLQRCSSAIVKTRHTIFAMLYRERSLVWCFHTEGRQLANLNTCHFHRTARLRLMSHVMLRALLPEQTLTTPPSACR